MLPFRSVDVNEPRRVRSAPDSSDRPQALSPAVPSPDDEPGASHPLLRAFQPRTWTATHDNDWVSVVCEQPDGSFALLVAAAGARDVLPDLVAASAEAAKAAARELVRVKSGHDRCTAGCRGWSEERHLVMLLAEDAGEFGGNGSEQRPRRGRGRRESAEK